MNRRHATIISAFLALALVLGTAAVLRTAGLGAGAASTGALAARNAQLDRYELQLRNAANARPPALPGATLAAAKEPQRVVYTRSQPVVEPDHHGDDHDRHDGANEHHDRDGHDDD